MKRVLLTLSLVCAVSFTLTSAVYAVAPNDLARYAMHVRPLPTKLTTICTLATPVAQGIPCSSYNTTLGLGSGQLVYIVAGNGPAAGLAGVSFGIDYAVGQYTGWNQCNDGLFFANDGGNGDFPAPLGGVRATWSTCQLTVVGGDGTHGVIGALYMYAYDPHDIQITPNNNLQSGDELAYTPCGGTTVQILTELAFDPTLVPLTLGQVGVGGASAGFTPCGVVPAQETTWGTLKNKYSN